MRKIEVPVSCCGIGDILSDDVHYESGIRLVGKNTILNQYIIEKLIEMSISKVWVYQSAKLLRDSDRAVKYDEIKSGYKEDVLTISGILNELTTGERLDYENINILQSVISDVKENSSIVKYFTKIKPFDEYTYFHCVNVSFYSMLIAMWLDLPENEIHQVIQAGLLHDVGKIEIPDEVLNKKGILTPSEFEVIKNHSIYGYNFIQNISELSQNVKDAVLLHHEKIDGSGYPYGIIGGSIPLYAKIVSIADVYDAMTTARVYKKKVTPFEAFKMFLSDGLNAFDTSVLHVFLNNLPAHFVGLNVELNNGEVGEIVYVPPHDIVNPVIRVSERYYDLSKTTVLKVLSIINLSD